MSAVVAKHRPMALIPLVILGCLTAILTALAAWTLPRPIEAFIGFAITSGIVAAYATGFVDKLDRRWALAIVLGFALVLRLIVLWQPPVLSDDVFRYVWDGRVQAAGINPYRFVPADPALSFLRDQEIFPFINRADYAVTIYPPVAQAFFFVVTRLHDSVPAMRLALVACEVVTIAVIVALLARLGRPPAGVVAYAWHPLPLWEIAGSGHVDGLMVALMMAGLWLVIGARRLSGAALVTLGALAKPLALLALPALWRPLDWRMVLVVLGVIALAYAPYLGVGSGVLGFLGSGYLREEAVSSGEGFWLLAAWQAVVGESAYDLGAYLGIAGAILALLALRAGFRHERTLPLTLAEINTLLLAGILLLSPNYPWYSTILVPFVALLGGAAGWFLTVGAFALYLNLFEEKAPAWLPELLLYGGVVAAWILSRAWRGSVAAPVGG